MIARLLAALERIAAAIETQAGDLPPGRWVVGIDVTRHGSSAVMTRIEHQRPWAEARP